MIELSKDDIDIIKNHSREFLEPILTITQISNLHLSEAELIQNKDFKKAISQMKEIAKQGYKSQFIAFVNIVMEADL